MYPKQYKYKNASKYIFLMQLKLLHLTRNTSACAGVHLFKACLFIPHMHSQILYSSGAMCQVLLTEISAIRWQNSI